MDGYERTPFHRLPPISSLRIGTSTQNAANPISFSATPLQGPVEAAPIQQVHAALAPPGSANPAHGDNGHHLPAYSLAIPNGISMPRPPTSVNVIPQAYHPCNENLRSARMYAAPGQSAYGQDSWFRGPEIYPGPPLPPYKLIESAIAPRNAHPTQIPPAAVTPVTRAAVYATPGASGLSRANTPHYCHPPVQNTAARYDRVPLRPIRDNHRAVANPQVSSWNFPSHNRGGAPFDPPIYVQRDGYVQQNLSQSPENIEAGHRMQLDGYPPYIIASNESDIPANQTCSVHGAGQGAPLAHLASYPSPVARQPRGQQMEKAVSDTVGACGAAGSIGIVDPGSAQRTRSGLVQRRGTPRPDPVHSGWNGHAEYKRSSAHMAALQSIRTELLSPTTATPPNRVAQKFAPRDMPTQGGWRGSIDFPKASAANAQADGCKRGVTPPGTGLADIQARAILQAQAHIAAPPPTPTNIRNPEPMHSVLHCPNPPSRQTAASSAIQAREGRSMMAPMTNLPTQSSPLTPGNHHGNTRCTVPVQVGPSDNEAVPISSSPPVTSVSRTGDVVRTGVRYVRPIQKQRLVRRNWCDEENRIFFSIARSFQNAGKNDSQIVHAVHARLWSSRSMRQIQGHLRNMRTSRRLEYPQHRA